MCFFQATDVSVNCFYIALVWEEFSDENYFHIIYKDKSANGRALLTCLPLEFNHFWLIFLTTKINMITP